MLCVQDIGQPDITHVIIGDLQPRTPVQAPASAPIVHFEWLKACHTAGAWVDEGSHVKQLAGAHHRKRQSIVRTGLAYEWLKACHTFGAWVGEGSHVKQLAGACKTP